MLADIALLRLGQCGSVGLKGMRINDNLREAIAREWTQRCGHGRPVEDVPLTVRARQEGAIEDASECGIRAQKGLPGGCRSVLDESELVYSLHDDGVDDAHAPCGDEHSV